MEHISQQIAKDLLKIKAVFFRPEEPFTWANRRAVPGRRGPQAALIAGVPKLFQIPPRAKGFQPPLRQLCLKEGLAMYFDRICGAPLGNEDGARKASVIRAALSYVKDASSVVMVGDRWHDVTGAHENGLPCIGTACTSGLEVATISCKPAAFKSCKSFPMPTACLVSGCFTATADGRNCKTRTRSSSRRIWRR